MTFRARFFTLFSFAVLAGTGFLAWAAVRQARQTYDRFDGQRDATLTAQFQRELTQRGQEVSYAMQGLADAEATLRMALDLSRAQADPSVYANDARGLATAHQLDFLDLVAGDGSLISSAQWPARSGYRNDWVASGQDWNHREAFLQRVDLPNGVALGVLAVRSVTVGEKTLYLVGGLRFDREFLHAVALPAGTREILYSNLESTFVADDLTSVDAQIDQPERFSEIVESAEKSQSPSRQTIQWTADRASTESFVAIPLTGRQNEPLGVVLIGSTQRQLATVENSILGSALVVAALGILAAIVLSGWASARASKPLVQVTAGLRQVAAGNWAAQVEPRGREEAGQLAQAFNDMTAHLSRERARLVQTERVAAWRDVTQRMTQEVKQYLFPIEVTVGGLTRARAEASPRFGDVLNESLVSLRAELDELKAAVNRFSEFAKMPQPRCRPVDVNEILRGVLQAFEPHFRALGRPPIAPELFLDSKIGKILGDPDLLRKALENLLLHSIDTMPSGGTLTVRTEQTKSIVRIQVSGSGPGFGTEQRSDPFSAFRARQTPGAALGLPTTQAVVSDHGGRFFAETVPGVGTTFHLEFAVTNEIAAPPAMHLQSPRRAIQQELAGIPESLLESISGAAPLEPVELVVPAAPHAVATILAPPPAEPTAHTVSSMVPPLPEVVPSLAPAASSAPPALPAVPSIEASTSLATSTTPPVAETKTESPDSPQLAAEPVPVPSASSPQSAEPIEQIPAPAAPPTVPVVSPKPAPPRSGRGLLPSLLGLDRIPPQTDDEPPKVPDNKLGTTPAEPSQVTAETSLKQD